MKLKIILVVIISVILIGTAGFFIYKKYIFDKTKEIDLIDRNKIRIEIINCSGMDKQASRTQDYLRELGFDVYGTNSGTRTIEKTTIIERINPDLTNAMAVSEVLAFNKKIGPFPINKKITPEIQKDLDSLLYLEVTVILGKDCEKFLPEPKPIY